MELNEVVALLFSPSARGIATGAGVLWLLAFGVRQAAAPMTRWGPPWSAAGRWLSGKTGGFVLGGVLAGAAALLKAASEGPMERAAWGSVLLAWLTAMGLNSAAKRAPGLAQVERGRRRRAGLAATLALALGVTLAPTSTWASERPLIEPTSPGLAAAPPSVGDIVDLATGPSLDVRAGRWILGVTVLGTVALVDLAPGWTLSAAMGGALLAPLDTSEPGAVAKAGLTLQLPGKTVRAALGAGGTYFVLDRAWGAWLAVLFHV